MASIPISDLKHSLRKLEFPFNARDALDRTEQLCIASESDRHPKNLEAIQEIIAEFIFCEVDKRGNKKRNMKSTAELSLLEVLCDHFSKAIPSSISGVRTSLFLWLFHPAAESRIRVLAKLVSLAISTRRVSVLGTAGLWMQCTLPASPQSTVSLASMLVKDFFVLTPLAAIKLRELPQLAALFTANLLTAFTAMFGAHSGSYVPPPLSLLEVVTQWVSDHPHLCLTPLHQQNHSSVVVADPITPVVGLFRWCILSPLQPSTTGVTTDASELETPNVSDEEKLFSCLHLSLMQGLLTPGVGLLPGQQSSAAVRAADLAGLVEDTVLALQKRGSLVQEHRRLLALDRLGQAVQTCLSADHVSGDSHLLLAKLVHLPQTRLLGILLTKDSHPIQTG